MPSKPSTTPARELLLSLRKMLIAAQSRFNHTGVMNTGEGADLFLHDPKTDAYFRVLVTPSTKADYTASFHPTSFSRIPNPVISVPFSGWVEKKVRDLTADLPSLVGTTRQAQAAEKRIVESLEEQCTAIEALGHSYTNAQDLQVLEATRHAIELLTRQTHYALKNLQSLCSTTLGRVEVLESQNKKLRADVECLEAYAGQYTPGGPTAEEFEAMDQYSAEAAELERQEQAINSPWESIEPHPYTTWLNSTLGICSTPLDPTGAVVAYATAYLCGRRASDSVHQVENPS